MATELQKQQPQGEQVETWKLLYERAWEQAFNEFMFLMAEEYSLELLIESNGQRVPSPTVALWREEMAGLSPSQMREGLRVYMRSERRTFKPKPQDIRDNASEVEKDKPQVKRDPNCKWCSGTGWRDVISSCTKNRRVTRCECERVIYGDQVYQRKILAAPKYEPEVNALPVVEKLEQEAKRMPRVARPLSDAESNRREQLLREQKEKLNAK